MEIIKLEWDTNFFNKKIGKLYLDNSSEFSIDIFKELVKKFELVYIYTKEEVNIGLRVIDKKITLVKHDIRAPSQLANINSIEFFNNALHDLECVKKLALVSGVFSRFKKDTNFRNNEYERLYLQWITNSITDKDKTHTLIYIIENKIVGLLTLSITNKNLAEIGLVAVDENYRGRGIGKQLLIKAFMLSQELGVNDIQVVTQIENKPALKLYYSVGFSIKNIINIYHYWNYDTI